ncbi:unnamed protein product [Orchesella dallaii]|uniref:Uncharacterized protein n=1 Tax=Orchesella dallaii TaxID=48710 RepID=A0ABP1S8X2_9HEXA
MAFKSIYFVSFFLFSFILVDVNASVKEVTTSEQFQEALNEASPGDEILLKSEEFVGNFTAKLNGHPGTPIQISGGNVNSTSITSLQVAGDYWKIEKLGIYSLVISGSNNQLSSASVSDIVFITGNSNKIKSSSFTTSTKTDNENDIPVVMTVTGNGNSFKSISVAGGSMVLKEESCCGEISSSSFSDGDLIVKGKNYVMDAISIAGGAFIATGCGNKYTHVGVNDGPTQITNAKEC